MIQRIPLEDRVLVLPDPPLGETVGMHGLLKLKESQERPQTGTVVAVGVGTPEKPMLLEVDDRVMYGKYSGQSVEVDGKEVLVMRMGDVLMKLVGE